VLPDVLQHGNPPLARQRGDGIEQRIVGAPARGELDPDHPAVETPQNLRAGVCAVIGIDARIPADPVGMRALQGKQGVVARDHVPRRGKVGRRGEAEAAQDRRHMNRDADPLARLEAAGVALAPVGARRALVQEVGVDVDEHGEKLDAQTHRR
jgi:hypothetical protein